MVCAFGRAVLRVTYQSPNSPTNSYNIEVIAPASARQIVRARVEEKFLVRETGDMYHAALGPLAASIRADGRAIQWVYNVLDKKKEAERVIFEDSDPTTGFLLVPDPKWKTHPDPLAEPDRAGWRLAPWTAQLACLAICHDRGVGSLRDLRRRHLPMLRNILEAGLAAIERVYGVERERVRVFVHYVPQFFHFHGAFRQFLAGSVGIGWLDTLEPGWHFERRPSHLSQTHTRMYTQSTSPACTSPTAWRWSARTCWRT